LPFDRAGLVSEAALMGIDGAAVDTIPTLFEPLP
jgi:hypothetical protein